MKPLLAVFAHPDDEAFGPSGKIALEAKKRDVYLICVTDGAMGINSGRSKKDLAIIRKKELKNSAKKLGVKKVFFLEYKDGSLSNSLYHKIAEKIEDIVKEIKADTLLTFEPRGVSGHLDHIAVSFITTFVFRNNSLLKKLIYYCIDECDEDFRKDYFIYFPKGYKKNEIDLTVDVSKVWDQKIAAMKEHKSQKHDGNQILEMLERRPKLEFFLVKVK